MAIVSGIKSRNSRYLRLSVSSSAVDMLILLVWNSRLRTRGDWDEPGATLTNNRDGLKMQPAKVWPRRNGNRLPTSNGPF
jgi:hypothetical protein